MKRVLYNVYDVVLTIFVMIFTPWGCGYFNRVRHSISRFEKFVGVIRK